MRIPSLFELLSFFAQVLGTGLIFATIFKFFLQKSKRIVDNLQLNALSAFLGGFFATFIIGAASEFPDVSSMMGSLIVAACLSVFIFPFIGILIALENIIIPRVKFLHIIVITIIVILIIEVFFPFGKSWEIKECNSESCRKSPMDCINGRLGNGSVCVKVNTRDLS